jgi:hypothetical protein
MNKKEKRERERERILAWEKDELLWILLEESVWVSEWVREKDEFEKMRDWGK